MYTTKVPYKNHKGQTRTVEVNFNFEIHEVMDHLVELNEIFKWRDSVQGDDRDLSIEEKVDFYRNFKTIVLDSWGVPSEDGESFDKDGKWAWEKTRLFAETMEMFFSDIPALVKWLEDMMPKGMEAFVKKQAASLNALEADPNASQADIDAEIARLQALKGVNPLTSVPNPDDPTPSA